MRLLAVATAALLAGPAAAAPLPTAPPVVGAIKPMAQLAGARGAFSLSSPCEAMTTKALATLPECQAALASNTTMAVIFASIAMNSPPSPAFDPPGAVALLERAIAKNDDPPLRYLLGTLLSTGEHLVPRYADARKHLDAARNGGNPTAADLLGTLWIQGKGGPQDIGTGLALIEEGVAGGFRQGLLNAIQYHLNGRWTPANPQRAEALLAAAERAGHPDAARIRAAFASGSKITNIQAIPPVGDAPPTSIAYTGFEGPELPPSVGFDAAFQKVHRAPFDDPAVLADLQARQASLPTPYLFELARRLGPSNPREAIKTLLLAQARIQYDADRCADTTAAQGAQAWIKQFGPELRYAVKTIGDQDALFKEIRAQEALLPADTVPVWICYHGISGNSAAIAGKRLDPLTKPAAQWQAIRAAVLSQLAGKP